MKTIIAGSRTIREQRIVFEAITASNFEGITEVVSGGCHGPDELGERWATEHSIPIKRFLAEWHRYGRKAGPIRNRQMADYADALIAVWDEVSYGTRNMIEEALARGLRVYIHKVPR